MVKVISGIALDGHRRLLMVRKKGIWILPGGKIETGESELICLIREIKEELPRAQLRWFAEGKEFFGQAPFGNHSIAVKTHFIEISGCIEVANEIEAAEFVNAKQIGNYPMSQVMADVVAHLIFEGKFLSRQKINMRFL